MRHRGLHRSPGGGPHPHRGPGPPGVPGLRLRGDRAGRRRRRALRREAGRQARQSPSGHPGSDAPCGDRARPHALGDPRPAERPQRPPAPGLHGRDHGHPQRDHRELPRPARRPRGARPHPGVRDGHRGPRPHGRGALPGRPRRRRPGHAPAVRGGVRDRRDASRRGRPARRGPQGRAARRRPGRWRELPRQRRRRDPRPHRPGRLPRGRRCRGPAPIRRDHHRRPRHAGGTSRHDHRLDDRGRREGRLRALHAQGDPRAARIAAPGHRRPGDPRGPHLARGAGGVRGDPAPGRSGRAHRLRDGLLRRARRGRRDPGLDRDPGPGDRRVRVPLQPAAARRPDAGRSRSRNPGRPPTPSPRPAWPGNAVRP